LSLAKECCFNDFFASDLCYNIRETEIRYEKGTNMEKSLKKIAETYNISVATLSRVVNNKGNVRPETKERVLEILKKEQYVPNYMARSLKTNSSTTIGIIVPDISQKLFAGIIRGINRKLFESGYLVLLSDSEESEQKEKRYLDLMLRQCVDGLVIATVDPEHIDFRRFYALGIPVVFIDTIPDTELQVDAVLVDDYMVGQKMAKYFLQKGHTKIAVLTGTSGGFSPSVQRLKGFLDTCEKQGTAIPKELIYKLPYSQEESYRVIKKLLNGGGAGPITAVAAMHELMAIGTVKAIREQNLAIGEDISLIGCDLNERIQLFKPQITGVEQPEEEIGETVAGLLLQRLRQKALEGVDAMRESIGQKILLNPRFVIRDSCKNLKK